MTPDPSLEAEKGLTGDEKIVHEAKRRFDRCATWEATARTRWVEDVKFYNGDSDNMYQWPSAAQSARGTGAAASGAARPCLTINKVRQHCLQIQNDQRQHKTGIAIKGTGNGATFEAAQVLEGICRHIEYRSNAQAAYGTATRFQVQGGLGYWRLGTDYVGDDTLEQDIHITRIKDPLSVYCDPDFSEADGSDMRFAFVFEDIARDVFEAKYPKYKDAAKTPLGTDIGDDGWVTEDTVRVAEYFRRVEFEDELIIFTDQDGKESTFRASQLDKAPAAIRQAFAGATNDYRTRRRAVTRNEVQWFKIIGDQIAERSILPGKAGYIPIVQCVGETTVIGGELDRKGHVRAMKDAQRMYNYNASAQVEYAALQPKTPWIAPVAAIEGNEDYWNTANTENHAVLTYNHMGDDGQVIPPPVRTQPPTPAGAFEVGLQTSAMDMMLASGQYESTFGEKSNERSGVAIQTRQRQGDNATYHFIDHLAMAIRFTGKIILDWIPDVYDTKRVVQIMAEDGTDSEVLIDPKAAKAYFKTQKEVGEAAEQVIFNPNVGRYEVMSDVGPAWGTRREEAFNAFTQIANTNKELMPLIGDLMFKMADFPYADEIAERLRRMVPPQALGDDDPAAIQAQHTIAQLQQIMAALGEKLQEQEKELKSKDAKDTADMYRAVSERMDILLERLPDPRLLAEQEHEITVLGHQTNADMAKADQAADLAPEPAEA